MRAALIKAANTPFVVEDLPDPMPSEGEAVARVLACGTGLTVHHARVGRVLLEYPRILGHEITGEVAAVGEGVTDLRVGDAVTAYYYLTCGRCYWCRTNRETLCDNFGGNVGREVDGGYAEYIKLPARSFLKLPLGLDWQGHPEEIAVVADAVATPFKLIHKARISPSDTVAVFGAGGGVGIHMLMLARWAHARRVIAVEIVSSKRESCLRAGADVVVDASKGDTTDWLLESTEGRGVDVAIDFVCDGSTQEAAMGALRKGGRLVLLSGYGRPFPVVGADLLSRELEVLGSRYASRQDVYDALDLVARGEIWPLVTQKAPLEQVEAIHQRLDSGLITGRAALSLG